MSSVRSGLYLCLVSILVELLITTSTMVLERNPGLLTYEQLRLVGQFLELSSWIVPGAWLLGLALCCLVPEKTGLRLYAQGALMAEVVAIIVAAGGQNFMVLPGLASLRTVLDVLSWLLLLFFLYSLSHLVNRPDIGKRCLVALCAMALGVAARRLALQSIALDPVSVMRVGMVAVGAGQIVLAVVLSRLASALVAAEPQPGG